MKTPHDHHNDGQRDRAEDNGYNPPHGTIDQLTTWSSEGSKKLVEDNEAYKEGWRHTDSQTKS